MGLLVQSLFLLPRDVDLGARSQAQAGGLPLLKMTAWLPNRETFFPPRDLSVSVPYLTLLQAEQGRQNFSQIFLQNTCCRVTSWLLGICNTIPHTMLLRTCVAYQTSRTPRTKWRKRVPPGPRWGGTEGGCGGGGGDGEAAVHSAP